MAATVAPTMVDKRFSVNSEVASVNSEVVSVKDSEIPSAFGKCNTYPKAIIFSLIN